MRRDVDIDEISDGRRYSAEDMVKISCNDCSGCSSCCHDTADTIFLDPYDIYNLRLATGLDFMGLLNNEYIEMKVRDGMIYPKLKPTSSNKACGFLSDQGRCKIHPYRPGICRLFPMGRIYENGSFSYFLQVNECPHENKSKIKLKKWLGIPDLKKYESYILAHHDFCRDIEEKIASLGASGNADEAIKNLNLTCLNLLYIKPYDSEDFYSDYYARLEALKTH